jgi:TolA-binding protein
MFRREWIAAALAASLAGCFYPADRGRALEARVDRLTRDSEAHKGQLEDAERKLRETLPRIDEKVAEVTRALESLDRASRRSEADSAVQLQKTIEDVAQLRGQMDLYLHKIGELEAQLGRTQAELEGRLASLQGPEAQRAAEARRKAEELERPTDKRQFLSLADQKAKAGEGLVARQLYGEFLKKWPKDPLTGDAHFGLGELFFAEDRCREALFEYGKVIQEHPRSGSAPKAYLRSSECFRKLKMAAEAKLALEELVKAHPKSDAATTARARLAELEPKKAPPPKKGKR